MEYGSWETIELRSCPTVLNHACAQIGTNSNHTQLNTNTLEQNLYRTMENRKK